MSEYHYIFARPGFPRERLVQDVSTACGVELRPADDEFVDRAGNLGYAAVEVEFTHEYEGDHGMPLERYDSLVTIRDFDTNLERQETTARQIFENLTALGRYDLLLTRDLQELLASLDRL
ncbi:hypothetical protein BN159_3380 [Streptomyces davaonensis JCM 4913]|uniref:Uncharacterized protein n=1 Tax=Streptomyces davaonensis (strain DSM 101723 / JCM 4913 / KCC S-0913 / 768) TaxID=1214101 RepID=K4R4W4_STRDJ|nr:hypothetical protein [Streptomyces davaonensis]CCK27759.1 hypothetical protein BN159_3380 [Streptomyces davaonensis JCM 4913]